MDGRPAVTPVKPAAPARKINQWLSGWIASLRVFGRAPLFFFGLGLYRAWIELVYVRPLVETPAHQIAGHDVYDISVLAILLLCACFAKRLIPLFKRRRVTVLCLALMTLGTVLSFLSLLAPSLATTAAAYVAAISSGAGTALIILYWSELYSCLNPLKVAFYYSGSLLFAALVIWLFMGLKDSYYIFGSLLLPGLSLLLLYKSYRFIEPENLPRCSFGISSFPWKPTALMAIYGFAYGLHETGLYAFEGPHSSFGTIAPAAMVFLGIILIPNRFSLAITYRIALPLMVLGFLLVPSFSWSQKLSHFCIAASFTSFSILTMLILSSISYRFGVGAVWLFGIERGVRTLAQVIGRFTFNTIPGGADFASEGHIMFTIVVVILVIAATIILLGEKELSSKWGINFLRSSVGAEGGDASEQHVLADVCARISREYNLSARESEILLLLGRKKSLPSIEAELFIANGTVKAHIRHIYGKLGIHKRRELLDMLGLSNQEG
jgi:DNA-binding CsgD family transcriptional regulator